PTTILSALPLHDALPISFVVLPFDLALLLAEIDLAGEEAGRGQGQCRAAQSRRQSRMAADPFRQPRPRPRPPGTDGEAVEVAPQDRKSTRLNSSHQIISF